MKSRSRITELFSCKSSSILNIYFTAGYPSLHDTIPVLRSLQHAGVDMVEIGIPYSDPVADGDTIQQSNQQALRNGMTLALLFDQLSTCRPDIHIPILLMGYLNPVLQFGVEAFCRRCQEVGVDGVILPDLPLSVYRSEFEAIFCRYDLSPVFLITPQTADDRIQLIDNMTSSFIYVVSSSGITGKHRTTDHTMHVYLQRLNRMNLKSPRLVGFGIYSRESVEVAGRYANGAIVGSEFIRYLQSSSVTDEGIHQFVTALRPLS